MWSELRDALRRAPWRGIAVGFLGALLVGILYALTVREGGRWDAGLPWERALLLRMHTRLAKPIDEWLLVVPWFGTNITLLPISFIAAFWLAYRRRAMMGIHLVVVEVGSFTLNEVLKLLFARPRPELWPHRGQYAQAAFPSGHAIASISMLFTIAALLYLERGWRWPFVAAAVLLVTSLYSRLYLGVHWPTDVIGGAVIGVVWLIASWRAFRPAVDKQ